MRKGPFMGTKRFIWSCLVASVFMGCGSDKKDNPQETLLKWSVVREGMSDSEISSLLGKPSDISFEDGETVYFFSSRLSEKELNQKGLQLSSLVVYMTNNVVKEKFISYR